MNLARSKQIQNFWLHFLNLHDKQRRKCQMIYCRPFSLWEWSKLGGVLGHHMNVTYIYYSLNINLSSRIWSNIKWWFKNNFYSNIYTYISLIGTIQYVIYTNAILAEKLSNTFNQQVLFHCKQSKSSIQYLKISN